MRPSLIALLGTLGMLAVGCTIPFEEGDFLEELTGPEQPPRRRSCDTLSEAETRRAGEAGEAALEEAELSLVDAWSDTAAFAVFAGAAARFADCAEETTAPDGRVEVGLNSVAGSTFCGLGDGGLNVNVSTCLNEACREHDVCSARCSSATSPSLLGHGSTDACDSKFMEGLACDDDSRPFRSNLVRRLAVGLHALGSLGVPTTDSSPGNGVLGDGPA